MKAELKYPFADTSLAVYLRKQIGAVGKSNREIAAELGYDRGNIISMFKHGAVKVPLDKLTALARALHVDPVLMVRLGLEQYWGKESELMDIIFKRTITAHEMDIISEVRRLTNNADVALTPKIKEKLADAFETGEYKSSELAIGESIS